MVFGYFDLFIIHLSMFLVYRKLNFRSLSGQTQNYQNQWEKHNKSYGHLIIEITELNPKHKKYFGKRIN